MEIVYFLFYGKTIIWSSIDYCHRGDPLDPVGFSYFGHTLHSTSVDTGTITFWFLNNGN